MHRNPSETVKLTSVSRRQFIRTAAATTAVLPIAFNMRSVHASSPVDQEAETFVGELYQSLSDAQKKEICLDFNHQKRNRINPNWHITQPVIGDDFYQASQRTLIDRIVKSITSEEGYSRIMKQMESDMPGGFNDYSIAFFGEPGNGKFQWEMTGRHLTMRADGNRVDKVAFGGPVIYGHGEEDPTENMFYYQTQKTNEVFKSLDADQAKQALLQKAPGESRLGMRDSKPPFAGIGVAELADNQKQLVEETMKVLLAPYRKEDIDEVFELIKSSGGLDKLHMSFYRDGDLEGDGVWDMWRIEGPGLVWHFRGAPHVHAYINIAAA